MSYEQIEYEVGDAVATITLNRPDALNPLSPEMCSEILAALKQAESDNDVRVVVLTGAGRGFSSGADVSGFAASLTGGEKPDLELGLKELFAPIFQAQRSLEKPVIAAVNGPCVGISVALALHADLVVAAESAYFLLAFAKIGLAPDGAAVMAIARRAGAGRAAEMALLADKIPAAQAQQWGLVNQVVADGELKAAVGALAGKLAAGPPLSYAASKELVNRVAYADLTETLAREGQLQQRCGEAADFAEGVQAFLQKRPASFTGA